eukprot:4039976-Pyramimonas_sp.AAC.1
MADTPAQRGAEAASDAIRSQFKTLNLIDARAILVHQRIGTILAHACSKDDQSCRREFGSAGSDGRLTRIQELEVRSGYSLRRLGNGQ